MPLPPVCLPAWMNTGVNWQAILSKYHTQTASWTYRACHLLHLGEDATLLLDRSKLNISKSLPDLSNCAHVTWMSPAKHRAKEKSGCVILCPSRTPHLAIEQHFLHQWDFLLHRSAISSSQHITLPRGERTPVFSTPESPEQPHWHYCQLCCQQCNKHCAHLQDTLGESNCSSAICGHSPASLTCEFLLHGG